MKSPTIKVQKNMTCKDSSSNMTQCPVGCWALMFLLGDVGRFTFCSLIDVHLDCYTYHRGHGLCGGLRQSFWTCLVRVAYSL